MPRLDLSRTFYAEADGTEIYESGQIYHIEYNQHGGSNATPIARFYVTTPRIGAEGFNPHKRLDCYVREHSLSPQPEWLGRILTDTLLSAGHLTEPVWTSWHSANEIGGTATGEVFDFD